MQKVFNRHVMVMRLDVHDLFVVIALVVCGCSKPQKPPEFSTSAKHFSSDDWKKCHKIVERNLKGHISTTPSDCYEMLDDLERRFPKGTSIEEITKLLGPSDQPGYKEPPGSKYIFYDLGIVDKDYYPQVIFKFDTFGRLQDVHSEAL